MAHLNAAYQRVAASGCETYGDSGVTIYEKHYIHIKGSGFEPASIDHAVPGDKLIFIHSMEGFNSSAAAMAVVVVEGLASSGILQAQGDRFEVQLPPKSDTARVYLAYNALCSFMVTKIASTPPATVATYGHSSGDSLSVGLVGSAEANQRVRGERYADSFVYAAANNQIAIVRRRLGLPEEHVAAPIGDLSTRPCEPTTVAPTRHNSQLNSQLLSNGPAVTGPQRLPLVAHPDVLDADGCTALAAAARAGHVRVLSLLIEAGADLNARCLSHKANGGGGGPKGSTALCVAANWGQASSISCLLHYSADAAHIHITNDQDRTPLHLAALNGHYDAVTVLLREGSPDPWLADYSGKTPLDLALDCGRSRLEIADALALYAAIDYAPSIGVFLAAADRMDFPTARTPEGAGGDSSVSLNRCPFRYLSALGSDTLGLIKLFVTAPPMATLAILDDNRARAKGEGYRSAHYAGYIHGDGSPRGEKDAQKYESDPRARSLPYLMRQSGHASAATVSGAAQSQASPPLSPNYVSTSTPTATTTSSAHSASVATEASAVEASTATSTRPAAQIAEEAELALAIAASLDPSAWLRHCHKE